MRECVTRAHLAELGCAVVYQHRGGVPCPLLDALISLAQAEPEHPLGALWTVPKCFEVNLCKHNMQWRHARGALLEQSKGFVVNMLHWKKCREEFGQPCSFCHKGVYIYLQGNLQYTSFLKSFKCIVTKNAGKANKVIWCQSFKHSFGIITKH